MSSVLFFLFFFNKKKRSAHFDWVDERVEEWKMNENKYKWFVLPIPPVTVSLPMNNKKSVTLSNTATLRK